WHPVKAASLEENRRWQAERAVLLAGQAQTLRVWRASRLAMLHRRVAKATLPWDPVAPRMVSKVLRSEAVRLPPETAHLRWVEARRRPASMRLPSVVARARRARLRSASTPARRAVVRPSATIPAQRAL